MCGACHGSYHLNIITIWHGSSAIIPQIYPKTAYCMHLGPSPFDSAPQTLRSMKFSFLGALPLFILYFLSYMNSSNFFRKL